MRALQSEEDRRRYAAFNTECGNSQEGATGDCLLHHHPFTGDDDYWMVEDPANHQVVSTTCLLPWHGRMATNKNSGVDLRVAQLEMVLTHPDYRGRGLVRAQIKNFHQVAQEKGYDLSIIWGIPYFYRQFGYSYSIEVDANEILPAAQAPSTLPGELAQAHLRPARPEDIPLLEALYEQSARRMDFYLTRDAAYWEYLVVHAHQPVQILEDASSGNPLGYAILYRRAEHMQVYEHSLSSAPAAFALLALLKSQSSGLIVISWPENSILAQAARCLGSYTQLQNQWLVRIPNVTQFLRKISPLLEARLEDSPFQGWDGAMVINLYKEAVELCFQSGRIEVRSLGFRDYSLWADGGDLRLPVEAFTRLVTGFRDLNQLRDAWPDLHARPHARLLAETLFPRMRAYLQAPYHYHG